MRTGTARARGFTLVEVMLALGAIGPAAAVTASASFLGTALDRSPVATGLSHTSTSVQSGDGAAR